MKKITLIVYILFIAIFIQAQTTGSFQQNITFSEPDYNFTRTLYYYVPSDYDSNQSYKLVVGFRGGPHFHAGEFRDQLAFLSDSIGAIIVCPENESHFNNQEGLTKQLFQYSVDTTMAVYNIDPDFIYLTGLSYGGRHATIVSMDTENGIIPNLRGVIPFAAGSNSHLEPDYADIADFPPACICIGLNDNSNFMNVANTLQSDLIANGGTSFLNEITGVGHTVDFPTYPDEMMECLNFIESQYESTAVNEVGVITKKDIMIYPNPIDQTFHFSYESSLSPKKIFLTDISGKTIMEIAPNQQDVDVSKLESGIKILVVITEKEMISKRLVIMH